MHWDSKSSRGRFKSLKADCTDYTYSTEEKRLVNCKGELKDTVTAKCAASKIVEVVKQVMSGDTPVILVAHNGNSFDHDRLLSFLERHHELHELSESFPGTLFFGDIVFQR